MEPPTAWPPKSRDHMKDDGENYWQTMCDIKGANGFGALTGKGDEPYQMCWEPWRDYELAFGMDRSDSRRNSVPAPTVSDTVSITPAQASLLIIISYVGAIVFAIFTVGLVIYKKFGNLKIC